MEYKYRNGLGEIRVIDILDWYDRPIIFSCKDDKEQDYIAILVDETKVSEVFLFVPLSFKRKKEIESGRVNVRNMILNVEGGFIWEVHEPFGDNKVGRKIKRMVSSLKEEELPSENFFLY